MTKTDHTTKVAASSIPPPSTSPLSQLSDLKSPKLARPSPSSPSKRYKSTPVKPTKKTTPKKPKAKAKTKKDPPSPKPLPWSAAHKIVLLNIASSRGASIKTFEGALEGRSGIACYIRWKHVILREIKGILVEEEKRDLRKLEVVKANVKEEKARRKPIKVKMESD